MAHLFLNSRSGNRKQGVLGWSELSHGSAVVTSSRDDFKKQRQETTAATVLNGIKTLNQLLNDELADESRHCNCR
jgi:hypothetical protein